MKPKVIHKLHLAGYLMMRGFVLVGMERNYNKLGLYVYIFNGSDDLESAISDYLIEYKRN